MSDEVSAFLRKLADESLRDRNVEIVPHGERPCPICGQKMLVDQEQNVQTDICPEHGIWLDAGELALIIGRTQNSERSGAAERAKEAFRKGVLSGKAGLWSWLID